MAASKEYPENVLRGLVTEIDNRTREHSYKCDKRGGVLFTIGLVAMGATAIILSYEKYPKLFGNEYGENLLLLGEIALMAMFLVLNKVKKNTRILHADNDKITILRLLKKSDAITTGDERDLALIKKRHDIGRALFMVASVRKG